MATLVVDTHAAVWYLQNSKRLSPAAQRAMDDAADAGDLIYVCSISLVEIVYLVEKGKLYAVVIDRLTAALSDTDAAFAIAALDESAALAVQRISRDIVPDMPDRIIAATALSLGLPLAHSRLCNLQNRYNYNLVADKFTSGQLQYVMFSSPEQYDRSI